MSSLSTASFSSPLTPRRAVCDTSSGSTPSGSTPSGFAPMRMGGGSGDVSVGCPPSPLPLPLLPLTNGALTMTCGHARTFPQHSPSPTLHGAAVRRLLVAAASGNVKRVTEALRARVDPNARNSQGWCAIHIASDAGHAPLVSILLEEAGVDVNVCADTHDAETPLYVAAARGEARVVDILLAARANVECMTRSGDTPLAVAVRNGYANVVTSLLASGARVNACGYDASTHVRASPLHAAAAGGDASIVAALLVGGADVHALTSEGASALHIASRAGRDRVVKTLLDAGARVDAMSRDGRTPLLDAVLCGHASVVTLLVAAGANVCVSYAPTLVGDSEEGEEDVVWPSLIAAKRGAAHIMATLVAAGARDVTRVDACERSAMHYAAENGHISVVNVLLRAGVSADGPPLPLQRRGDAHFTPLCAAAMRGHAGVVATLIAAGASVAPPPFAHCPPSSPSVSGTPASGTPASGTPASGTPASGTPASGTPASGSPAFNDAQLDRPCVTPLLYAAIGGNVDILHMLLAVGANLEWEEEQLQGDSTPLLIAIKCAHVGAVRCLLNAGARVCPRITSPSQWTALTHALCCSAHDVTTGMRRQEIIRLLLDKGVDVNEFDGARTINPLLMAAFHGRADLFPLLLNAGADVNATAADGTTPLYNAVRWGALSDGHMIACLLEAGARVNDARADGVTPLHAAAKRGHAHTVMTLLRAGAHVHTNTRRRGTPLHAAAFAGHAHLIPLLITSGGADVNARMEDDGVTPLLSAAWRAHADAIDVLLEHGANVHAVTADGVSALLLACEHPDGLHAAQRLLARGARVDAMTVDGDTPLHAAAGSGNARLVTLLLDHGARMDVDTGAAERTPLMLAAREGHVDVLDAFADHASWAHVVVDACSQRNGETALHMAVRARHVDAARWLVEHGARVDAVTLAGETPLFLAVHGGCTPILDILSAHGVDTNVACRVHSKGPTHMLCVAAEQGHASTVCWLLGRGACVMDESVEEEGNMTPLWIAAARGHDTVVALLLEAGARVEHVPARRWTTPLLEAARHNHANVVRVLLGHGANVHFRQRVGGEDALYMAADRGHTTIVRLLLDAGACADWYTQYGHTPLGIAAAHGYDDVARMLLDAGASERAASLFGPPLHVFEKLRATSTEERV